MECRRVGSEITSQASLMLVDSSASAAENSTGGVLGDGLGAFGNGVSGELSGEDESDGGLDLTAGEGLSLVVSDESGGLTGDSLEDIVDEGVHDAHGLLGDTGLGVDLLEDTVDVDGEGLDSLLVSGGSGSDLLGGFSGGTGSGTGHIDLKSCPFSGWLHPARPHPQDFQQPR